MAQIQKGTTFVTGAQVTADNLNAHVDSATLLSGAIGDQVNATSVSLEDSTLILQAGSLKEATIAQIKTATNQDLSGLLKIDGSVAMTGNLNLLASTSISGLNAAPVSYVDNKVTTTFVKASNSEVAAFSNVQKYISPELLPYAFSSTQAEIGYLKLPGGLIMQWGNISPANGEVSVVFPIAFSSAVYSIQITLKGPGSPDNGLLAPDARNWTLSGFTLRVWDQDSYCAATWFAIGK